MNHDQKDKGRNQERILFYIMIGASLLFLLSLIGRLFR
ncbi:hypothetical protein QFZ72_002039 [Bacillus sp. V2I10]|jgi:hypothetical protein|nr:hypothetical protein [Bacillus sp. V2I10]